MKLFPSNKRGASVFVVLMFVMLLIFFAIAIASALNTGVQAPRTNMNCETNFTNLDYGSKIVCKVTDLYSPLFVALIIGIGGTLIAIKLSQS